MLMSKKIYVGIYAASFGLCSLTLIAPGETFVFGSVQKINTSIDAANAAAARIGFYAVLQFVVVHAVFNFLLLARMWSVIQDGQTSVTVGKAIGFMFIPLFNVYWVFRVWSDFPVEYNNYVDRYALPVPHLSGKVFVAYPILLLAGILSAPLVALPFLFVAVSAKTCAAVDVLNEAVEERKRELMQSPTRNQAVPNRRYEQYAARS